MTLPEIKLDARGLPPCELMEQIFRQLEQLEPGQRLLAMISSEPAPFYLMLAQRGYDWRIVGLEEEHFELLIWAADNVVISQR